MLMLHWEKTLTMPREGILQKVTNKNHTHTHTI